MILFFRPSILDDVRVSRIFIPIAQQLQGKGEHIETGLPRVLL